MNLLQLVLIYLLAFTAHNVYAATDAKTEKVSTPAKQEAYKEISTDELKQLIESKKPVTIFDARRKLRGGLLPGAKNLPYDSEDKEFAETLNSVPKNATIVVYCANIYCPLSAYLAEHLVTLGYTNIYKYSDGVAGWLEKDYPLDPIKKP